jgi:hypothetical protein
MTSPITQSAVSGILKELYDDQKVQWLTYKDNPALAMIHKEEKFPGKYYPVSRCRLFAGYDRWSIARRGSNRSWRVH